MKYIMIHKSFKDECSITYPIIFPNELNHCDVADQMISLLKSMYAKETIEVVSAGSFNVDTCQCGGHSETLNLESSETDGMTIRLRDYYMFYEATEPLKRIK
ncbi:MAG TPA: hypothetical protein DF610_19270 [Sphingobacterium sp.]|nr:hypothetical protein [Sphingobacterium sp.]